jgi:hypothetical protein
MNPINPIAQNLIAIYRNNHNIIHMQLKDISHAESLIQPPYQGNCLNWVVGHLLDIRDECLAQLGLPGMMTEAEKKMYGYGSQPITDGAQASELGSLVERLDQSLGILIDELNCLSPVEMERETRIWRGPVPLREAIAFIQWHETFHTGQLEQLRQLAGKNDHVI